MLAILFTPSRNGASESDREPSQRDPMSARVESSIQLHPAPSWLRSSRARPTASGGTRLENCWPGGTNVHRGRCITPPSQYLLLNAFTGDMCRTEFLPTLAAFVGRAVPAGAYAVRGCSQDR